MAESLKSVLKDRTGGVLTGWLQFFDSNGDSRIDFAEFERGLQRIGFAGDAEQLFRAIDDDVSGFLTISEIDLWSADLWGAFKRWCVQTFSTKEDLVCKMRKVDRWSVQDRLESRAGWGGKLTRVSMMKRRSVANREGSLEPGMFFTKYQFIDNAARHGWYGAMENLVFRSLDVRDVGAVTIADISTWWDAESGAHRRRGAVKSKKHKGRVSTTGRTRTLAQHALQSFKRFLCARWRYLFHAWRSMLDRDGSMTVMRKEVFRACSELGWHGDAAALWHSLDRDDSGVCGLDEFCLAEARTLCMFRREVQERWGSVLKFFKVVCRYAKVSGPGSRISKTAWVTIGQKLGCRFDLVAVFDLMAWECEGSLCLRDVRCIDCWEPADWLTAQPDDDAADAFKKVLLEKFDNSPVRAWRAALDPRDSGASTYKDFSSAAEKVGFKGSVAGAFLALDESCDGAIELEEIDESVANELRVFRLWAYQAFGSVALAFEALDRDRSGSLSRREFRKAAKDHYYKGDIDVLFGLLDCDGGGTVSRSEATFLDDWCETLSVKDTEEDCDGPGGMEAWNGARMMLRMSMRNAKPLRISEEMPSQTLSEQVSTALDGGQSANLWSSQQLSGSSWLSQSLQDEPVEKPSGPQLLSLIGWTHVGTDSRARARHRRATVAPPADLSWAAEVRKEGGHVHDSADLLGASPSTKGSQELSKSKVVSLQLTGSEESDGWPGGWKLDNDVQHHSPRGALSQGRSVRPTLPSKISGQGRPHSQALASRRLRRQPADASDKVAALPDADPTSPGSAEGTPGGSKGSPAGSKGSPGSKASTTGKASPGSRSTGTPRLPAPLLATGGAAGQRTGAPGSPKSTTPRPGPRRAATSSPRRCCLYAGGTPYAWRVL